MERISSGSTLALLTGMFAMTAIREDSSECGYSGPRAHGDLPVSSSAGRRGSCRGASRGLLIAGERDGG